MIKKLISDKYRVVNPCAYSIIVFSRVVKPTYMEK